MSIPLDSLYHYINRVAKEVSEDVIIYRFWPHGSKNLNDLEELEGTLTFFDRSLSPTIICHDQEPLNFKPWSLDLLDETQHSFIKILKSIDLRYPLNHNLEPFHTVYNKKCILHSEQRSEHVVNYQAHQAVPVYYWSHAIISLDWFRFAQHLEQTKNVKKTFLIYNRAWSGTREYRLYFSDLLIQANLQNLVTTSVNPIEPQLNIHYRDHQFKNPDWKPDNELENYFSTSSAKSTYSATFDIEDYESTDIEIVLETLFDDNRLHLTEKSLRPIACAQPFILAGTHGSLGYLRNYGFKTFGDVWDESYDTIEDPKQRLHTIVDLMTNIANWDHNTRLEKMAQAQAIADYNKQHFFSSQFFNKVVNELKENLRDGILRVKREPNYQGFIDRWQWFLSHDQIKQFVENPVEGQALSIPDINQINLLLDTIKKRL